MFAFVLGIGLFFFFNFEVSLFVGGFFGRRGMLFLLFF